MTENVEPTAAPGATPQPTGAPSGTPAPTSAISDQLLQALEQIVDRKLQSQKDKRVAGIQGQLNSFESQLARLREMQSAKGWTEAQAIEVMRLQDAVESKPPVQTEAPRPDSQAAQPANFNPQSVIELMGLDVNSPEVIEVVRANPDPLGQIAALAKVAEGKRQAAAPNPAQQAVAATGVSVQQETIETLVERLAVLNLKPGTNMNEIMEINRKLAKLRGR